jgi:hypothetical protein
MLIGHRQVSFCLGFFNFLATILLILSAMSLSAQTIEIKLGLAGHIADETSLGFPQSAFQSSNIGGNLSVSFAFHDDHGYAYNPIGFLIHWITDVLGHNTRKPC